MSLSHTVRGTIKEWWELSQQLAPCQKHLPHDPFICLLPLQFKSDNTVQHSALSASPLPPPPPRPFPLAPDAFVKQAGEAVNKTLWDKSDTGS